MMIHERALGIKLVVACAITQKIGAASRDGLLNSDEHKRRTDLIAAGPVRLPRKRARSAKSQISGRVTSFAGPLAGTSNVCVESIRGKST
jgi:hypothetical protein